MDKRLRIERNAATEGTSAQFYEEQESWVEYMTVSGAVEDRTSRKVWQAQQIHEEITHIITIHWRQDFDVTKEIRFKWTDRAGRTHTVYPMGPPLNDGNWWLVFDCSEQVG